MTDLQKIKSIPGPILIIGASGFIGANLFHKLRKEREDVFGTFFNGNLLRVQEVPKEHLVFCDINSTGSLESTLNNVRPRTIFCCTSFGAYSFENDLEKIHSTNFLSLVRLLDIVSKMNLHAFVHAGSSSEYGLNSAGPLERGELIPNSHYAVSKVAASAAITFYGKVKGLPVVNLRLYSVYGPYEDSSRIIPTLCRNALKGKLPKFADRQTTRDFIHVDDVILAFVNSAFLMNPKLNGESINIGTGIATCLQDLASLAKTLFDIQDSPVFDETQNRSWDTDNWHASIQKAKDQLNWVPTVEFKNGLKETFNWWEQLLGSHEYQIMTKKSQVRNAKSSLSVVIACYKDVDAIPILYQRLTTVLNKIVNDYEIIFVNDGSPDLSSSTIMEISSNDNRVLGVVHSRNFGSQAAFRSGMEIAAKQAVVLMDGDLQDPPELIEEFFQKWRDGADVVYGVRIKREMPYGLEFFYRAFYRIFAFMSEFPVPRDAGDFSLIDITVVRWLLECRERDLFLRGLRAFVGFKQVGVEYYRPDRMFGVSTNNWIKNIGWAKKGIFSFSRMPLHVLTAIGSLTTLFTLVITIYCVVLWLIDSGAIPPGITFLSIITLVFGSLTILSIGLLGEYIGKILEETKARPHFIRQFLIVNGEARAISEGRNEYSRS